MTEDMPSDDDRAARALAKNIWGTLESIDANLRRIADILEAITIKGESNLNMELGEPTIRLRERDVQKITNAIRGYVDK